MSNATSPTPTVVNYFHLSHWGDEFLRFSSLDEGTQEEKEQEVEYLKEAIKEELMGSESKALEHLKLVDAIERLGLAYHFEEEIEKATHKLYESYKYQFNKEDLYHVSTRFRILRQHGFYVTCDDVFKEFKDDEGHFNGCKLKGDDIRGTLSLYEASHVRIHGEDILDEACAFTTSYLKSKVHELSSPLSEQVAHALHQPLHKGMVRLESKHYISFYEQDASHNKTLLKLAKLDFNLLQHMHQKELQDFNGWWKELYTKVPYTRDRLVEAYFWVLGTYYEPKYSTARKMFIKLFMILQVFDDIFDAYGTYEILKLLVEAVYKWDYSYVAKLPDYFSTTYQVLLETLDELEKELSKEGRSYGVHYIKEQLNRVCKMWLVEAKWCYEKHVPKYDEYMKVAVLSIGHVVGIISSFLGMGCASKEEYEWVGQDPMPKFVEASNVIFRLMNDLGSTEFEQSSRKHVVSSVQCYMKENGILEKEHVYEVLEKKVEDAWKDMNQGMLQPYVISKPLLDRILHITRGADVFYKGRKDAYTIVDQIIKDKITYVLFDPIPL